MKDEIAENKRKIIEIIDKIENAGTLEYLHEYIELYMEKWG